MPAKKYTGLSNGIRVEVPGTVTSAGVSDDGKIVSLDPSGKLDATLFPPGLSSAQIVQASETLAAGDAINLHDVSGSIRVRKADASFANAGKSCDGFVAAGVASGANATVLQEGANVASAGLTVGARVYLAATPGGVTSTPPATAGHTVQCVGRAMSATSYLFDKEEPTVLA
jgi:hypothetical protein